METDEKREILNGRQVLRIDDEVWFFDTMRVRTGCITHVQRYTSDGSLTNGVKHDFIFYQVRTPESLSPEFTKRHYSNVFARPAERQLLWQELRSIIDDLTQECQGLEYEEEFEKDAR